MYYLRKEPYPYPPKDVVSSYVEKMITVPKHSEMMPDRAIYKSNNRFFRQHFESIDTNIPGMKLYTCKTIKKSQKLEK